MLRRWFDGLRKKTASERRSEIILMSAKMTAKGEDADLIACFLLLADERVFDAVYFALNE